MQPTTRSDDPLNEDSDAGMASTAAAQVGETAELVELILSYLPLLDIVTASVVSKTFRNVIFNSLTLQRKLFLRPTNALPQYWLPLERFGPRTTFRTVTVDATSEIFEPTAESKIEHDDLPLRVVSVCPLLETPSEAQGFWARHETSSDMLGWNPSSTSPHQWYLLPTKKVTGPWKDMFLTNPPCKSVRCTLLWEGWVRGVFNITLEATRHVYRESGITIADLIDDTCSIVGQVDLHTAYEDEHCMAVAQEGGGYRYTAEMSTLHDQVEACKKKNRCRWRYLA
jgi:hypothetical protein